MRIYLPATLTGLARARTSGTLDGQFACAVTPAVREWYVDDDLEQLEFSALLDAAQSSLDLLDDEPGAPRRRVVVAADVPEALVTNGGPDRSSVQLAQPVALDAVVSLHIDEEDAADVVAAAVDALAAARDGDEDAEFTVSETEGCDLLWYDITELDDLIG
jgi:hypothetical protein